MELQDKRFPATHSTRPRRGGRGLGSYGGCAGDRESPLTVTVYTVTVWRVKATFSIEELAAEVQAWCTTHGVVPGNGQASERLSERNIRYYRTLGLLDPPMGAGPGAFGEKHRLQLVGIRLLQAQGLPLRRIRELLYGLDLESLRELERRGLRAQVEAPRIAAPPLPAIERWVVIPVDGDYLLVSRTGREPSAAAVRRVAELLERETRTSTHRD